MFRLNPNRLFLRLPALPRLLLLGAAGSIIPLLAQDPLTGVSSYQPNLYQQTAHALRYQPRDGDFLIANGDEFFNRPLYGGNTAFRVDGGDRPEFALYLPGRGGNLRLGIRRPDGAAKWLLEAAHVTTRYRPGGLIYTIRDPYLEAGEIELHAYAVAETDGLIVRVTAQQCPRELQLIWAFGGVTGQRGIRDGDIGTEKVPISEYFQLQPENCRGNRIETAPGAFRLVSAVARLIGSVPPDGTCAVADAKHWADSVALLNSTSEAEPELPVAVGSCPLGHEPRYLLVQRVDLTSAEELATYRDVSAQPGDTPTRERVAREFTHNELPALFARTETHFGALRNRVSVRTPDPFLNAAVAALNIAADAVWDEPQGVVMHGAIAWRSRLLGWRGPYAMDALGWHDRARRHLAYWATRQDLSTIPETFPPPEEATNLARSRSALHSQGNLSNSHYDMNLVYIDALLRHLEWTGDLNFAREVWPVIERHLAWEQRLFRREFKSDGVSAPLYEAYAAIWASDDLQYHGGGVTYTSAYNAFHHRRAARLAQRLGYSSEAYEREADGIEQAMRRHLWIEEQGSFGEFKDWLGRQLIHPSPGLWSIYHPIDSRMTTPAEAWRMTAFAAQHFPWLPVHGPSVPDAPPLGVFGSTDWMPYTWSVNNVVFGENVHTALAFWQAGRSEDAYRLARSAILAAMYLGICPGNVGSMSYLDVYRREAQRDFADGSGVFSRALIEGLFGVRPDLLEGEVVVAPGFPEAWSEAQLDHPDVGYSYLRSGDTERFRVDARWPKAVAIKLQVRARAENARATINGRTVTARRIDRGPAPALLEIVVPPGPESSEVSISWSGERDAPPAPSLDGSRTRPAPPSEAPGVVAQPVPPDAVLEPVDLTPWYNDRVTQIFRNEYRSPRSPFVSLAQPKQGIGAWAGHVNATASIDDSGLRAVVAANGGEFPLPNGVRLRLPGPGNEPNVLFVSQWDNYPTEATLPLQGRARRVTLLLAGSTNWMQSRIDNGEVEVRYRDGTTARLPLHNPTNWWPIDQDYFIDDYQFHRPEPIPWRVDLQTGSVRQLEVETFKGRGGKVPGGAATVLELQLDPTRELEALTLRAIANEVVIGLMGATLVR